MRIAFVSNDEVVLIKVLQSYVEVSQEARGYQAAIELEDGSETDLGWKLINNQLVAPN